MNPTLIQDIFESMIKTLETREIEDRIRYVGVRD
jgi:hypothetical protein